MAKWQFTKGLHDIGNGCWAWLQPNGGWGWSNAGLITDGEASLLVDTLWPRSLNNDHSPKVLPVCCIMFGISCTDSRHVGEYVNIFHDDFALDHSHTRQKPLGFWKAVSEDGDLWNWPAPRRNRK